MDEIKQIQVECKLWKWLNWSRKVREAASCAVPLWTRHRWLTFWPSLNQTPSQSSLLSLHISSVASLMTALTSDKPQMKCTPGSETETIRPLICLSGENKPAPDTKASNSCDNFRSAEITLNTLMTKQFFFSPSWFCCHGYSVVEENNLDKRCSWRTIDEQMYENLLVGEYAGAYVGHVNDLVFRERVVFLVCLVTGNCVFYQRAVSFTSAGSCSFCLFTLDELLWDLTF